MEVDEPEVITVSDDEPDVTMDKGDLTEERIAPEVEHDSPQIVEPVLNSEKFITECKEKGNEHYAKGRHQDAYNEYSKPIELWPDLPACAVLYANRSTCMMAWKKYDSALQELEKAKQVDPEYSKYLPRLIKIHTLRADFNAAAAAIKQVQEKNIPKDDALIKNLHFFCDMQDVHRKLMQNYEKGMFRDAHYYVRRLLENYVFTLHLKVIKAECQAELGNLDDSILEANSVLVADMRNADAFYVRGKCYYYKDDPEQTIKDLKTVLKFDPDHRRARELLKKTVNLKNQKADAKDAYDKGDFSAAYDHYSKGLEIDQKNDLANAKLHCNRAMCLTKMKRHKEALPEFDKALSLDCKYYRVLHRRGQCYDEMENYEAAVKDFETLFKSEASPANRKLLLAARTKLKRSKMVDYYKVLGVSQTATSDEITKAYKKKAMLHHPDKHNTKSDEERKEQEALFKVLGEAHETLKDSDKRMKYDRELRMPDCDDHQGFTFDTFPTSGFAQSPFGFTFHTN